jgi:hypothetical protein
MQTDLAARIQRLEDIEAIKQLKHRYLRALDMADREVLAATFTDDVEVDYQGASYRWQASGRETLLQGLLDAFNPRMIGCHTAHHPEITITGADTAEGIWYLTDVSMDTGRNLITAGSALYRDVYAKVDGTWLIRRSGYSRIYEQVESRDVSSTITFSHLATMAPPRQVAVA